MPLLSHPWLPAGEPIVEIWCLKILCSKFGELMSFSLTKILNICWSHNLHVWKMQNFAPKKKTSLLPWEAVHQFKGAGLNLELKIPKI